MVKVVGLTISAAGIEAESPQRGTSEDLQRIARPERSGGPLSLGLRNDKAVTTGSPTLSFFGSPEGRVVNNSGSLTYEYSIADHQGNTRVVFTSATPSAAVSTATFEASTNAAFLNYPTGGNRSSASLNNNTSGGGFSQYLNGGNGNQVGVAKTFKFTRAIK